MPVTIGWRQVIAALGGAAAAWPLAARAQQGVPVIVYLSGASMIINSQSGKRLDPQRA